MEHIFEIIANLIINGAYEFKKVIEKLRPGVTRKLKEKGREDLATDSNAKGKEKEVKDE